MKKLSLVLIVLAVLSGGLAFGADFLVSLGKPYTLFQAPSASYPDPDGKKLTDGSFNFAWGDMVGFENPKTNPIVTVDLQKVYEDLSYVAVKFMYSSASAVNMPASFIVSTSEDGEVYEDVGMGLKTLEPAKTDTIMTMYWAPAEAFSARFVQIEVKPTGAAWTMLCEAQVGSGAFPADLKGKAKVETAAKPDAKYAKISTGKPYVLVPVPSDSYPDPDGKKVTDDSYKFSWGDMIGFDNPKMNPMVVIDLQAPRRITRVSSHFMRSFASAVNLPRSLVISASSDNKTFTDVGLATSWIPDPVENEKINELAWVNTGDPVTARYVKIEIRPRGSAWTMLAESSVFGE